MITLDNVSFRYKQAAENTLHNLQVTIAEGEVFGFLGPSGSGKSTTQKILYKHLVTEQGSVSVNGKSLRDWGREYYHFIGVCFELPNHYLRLTARENLQFFSAFYPQIKQETINYWLDKMGLLEEADKRVSEFSKGMKMRLNFIRSVMHNPAVVFLDEPTSGLDPGYAHKVKEAIKGLKQQGKTIFLTTHNMNDADQLCDRVAFLHKGHIKEMDSPRVLKLKYGSKKVQVTDIHGQAHCFEMSDLSSDPDFQQLLQGNLIESIHSEEASLEEAFLKTTETVQA
ncbi:ABC transporter ATP-binding protein [Cytophagales bacterium LB-30]|uniref:ABC transporter ATP-binding protein n=1 Tax=Shiella aurantiaca TaxID=3058365 RepID=A0ABT8FA76_9BACT|nr:ABC transporter ATP-binding protein [Shiella aurantiaca]MDN4166866.1 ABC transporter ATP-binding protein [Shiella aurantiaca]